MRVLCGVFMCRIINRFQCFESSCCLHSVVELLVHVYHWCRRQFAEVPLYRVADMGWFHLDVRFGLYRRVSTRTADLVMYEADGFITVLLSRSGTVLQLLLRQGTSTWVGIGLVLQLSSVQ